MASHAPTPDSLRLTVLCGNPRQQSRTLAAATAVADRILSTAPAGSPGWHRTVVDLAEIGHQLFAPQRAAVENALARVTGSDLLIVATPVYKGSYSGLLKGFLDWLPYRGLEGAVAVPLTVMASPTHALAADLHLRPLLLELGAVVPTGSVVLGEDTLGPQSPDLQRWTALYAQLALQTATAVHHRTRREEVPA
ncbi:MAG: NADPH-dependent FMN reductase [Nocardioidaceae bacterium]